MRQCRVAPSWPTRARKRAIRRNSDDVQCGESPASLVQQQPCWSAVTSAWRRLLALNGGVFRLFGPWFGRQVRVLNWQEQQGAPTCDARLMQK